MKRNLKLFNIELVKIFFYEDKIIKKEKKNNKLFFLYVRKNFLYEFLFDNSFILNINVRLIILIEVVKSN